MLKDEKFFDELKLRCLVDPNFYHCRAHLEVVRMWRTDSDGNEIDFEKKE